MLVGGGNDSHLRCGGLDRCYFGRSLLQHQAVTRLHARFFGGQQKTVRLGFGALYILCREHLRQLFVQSSARGVQARRVGEIFYNLLPGWTVVTPWRLRAIVV